MALLKRKQAPPWQRFRVGSPSPKNYWVEPDCQPLTQVSHVAHLEAAHRIVVDGRIRSGLISDESKLKAERIVVAWLSPNYWTPGFRYGSVRFVFPWDQLVKGHRAYWVETMDYGVIACRILLTQRDYSEYPLLIPYDPTVGDGPWWHDKTTDTHYRNGNVCLEFMVEHDVELADLADFDFVKHHEYQCSIDPSRCPERGMLSERAAARFLARLAATGSKVPAVNRADPERPVGYERDIESAVALIGANIADHTKEFNGPLTSGHSAALPVCRALLNAYSSPALQGEIPVFASRFQSVEDMVACCDQLIRSVAPSSS